MNRGNFVNRPNLAKFYRISPGTLGVWQTKNRYKLPCELIGNNVYYPWEDVYRFISFDEDDYKMLLKLGDRTPLFDTKSAALYANCSVSTLRNSRSQGAPIRPRYVGAAVRYRKAELDVFRKWREARLDAFLESRMNPYLFI